MIDIIKIFAEDKDVIIYRPCLNKAFKKVTATILLQQIIYWYNKNKSKPFFKFKEPCNHSLYKEGDSWTEELSFSRTEFDSALKIIAKKITQNNKEEAHDKPVEYWTTSGRVTYYTINENNLLKVINLLYEKQESYFTKSRKPDLHLKQESYFTKSRKPDLYYTETTTDIKTTTDIYIPILEHWNSKNIIVHKKEIFEQKLLTQKKGIKSIYKDIIKNYSIAEIKKAIDNYSCIIKSENYYFNYKWSLWEFLQRGLDKFLDNADPKNNYKKDSVVMQTYEEEYDKKYSEYLSNLG